MGCEISFRERIGIFNNKTINIPGLKQYVCSDITIDIIYSFVNNIKLKVIQISEYISNDTITLLNDEVFSKRPDIQFRIFGFYSDEYCDLTFLKLMHNVQNLSIDCIFNVSNINVLSALKNLKELHLEIYDLKDYSFLSDINDSLEVLRISAGGRTNTFDCDCNWLLRFKNLAFLYLGKVKKNIDCIVDLMNLKTLILRGITLKSLDFLSYSNVESLSIHWGAMSDLNSLSNNKNLIYLELWRINKMFDLSFLNTLSNLNTLKLDQLANIVALPDLSTLNHLSSIYIDDLKKLKDISCLQYVNSLTLLEMYAVTSITKESLISVLKNRNLQSVCCYTGGKKKNEEIDELIMQAGKLIIRH